MEVGIGLGEPEYTNVKQEVSLTANWQEYSYVLNSNAFMMQTKFIVFSLTWEMLTVMFT